MIETGMDHSIPSSQRVGARPLNHSSDEAEELQQRRPLLNETTPRIRSRKKRPRKPVVPRRQRRLRSLLRWCCDSRTVQTTVRCMNCLARLVFWGTVVALVALVFWYSHELYLNGTEGLKIAWFSAGAFVLLGFPIAMWGIISHLANYNQPRVQVYIVRILWMVPIYSIQSWLAMKYHKKAIYIETLRDFYESYVLYSFFQFLIEVLGGEEALVLMLKDKSPTRGFHMWGMQWCLKPWLMGQPERQYDTTGSGSQRRIGWKSPFFIKCKFGVLQYVLLKFVTAIVVLILEFKGLYREGDFSWNGGYLYICIVTNVSQCWALYCLIFFYYATHNELGPIRPVGKFLSVKALVFFTWWQSVMIAILHEWDLIPDPQSLSNMGKVDNWTKEDMAKAIQDYLICIEMFIAAVVHAFVFPHEEYSPQAVEARSRALDHSNPDFPTATPAWSKKRLGRSKYHPQPYAPYWSTSKDDASKTSNLQPNSGSGFEMVSIDSGSNTALETWDDPLTLQHIKPQDEENKPSKRVAQSHRSNDISDLLGSTEDEVARHPIRDEEVGRLETVEDDDNEDEYDDSLREYSEEYTETSYSDDVQPARPGFVRALIDTAIPRDLGDSTIGIVKGDYNVEKKTLLYHATTSDQYELFSPNRRIPKRNGSSKASR